MQWQDVADCQRSILPRVYELPAVHPLVGNERLGLMAEAVWISEG